MNEQPTPGHQYMEIASHTFDILKICGVTAKLDERETLVHIYYTVSEAVWNIPPEEQEQARATLDQHFSELEAAFKAHSDSYYTGIGSRYWSASDSISHHYFSPSNVSELRRLLNIPKTPPEA